MKNRRKKSSKLLYYLAIAFFILISLFLVEYQIHRLNAKKLSIGNVEITNQIENKSVNANVNSSQPSATSPTPNQKAIAEEKTNMQIPILMYHYVRDYNNPNDKIGVNLSVSLDTFKKQLDAISQKGYTPVTFLDLDSKEIPQKPIIITFDDGYADFYQNAWPILKEKNFKAVSFVITADKGGNYMTNDQIKEVSNAGIEIGSHTVSHPDLSKTNDEKALQEISQSKTSLENITGKKIISFCYPSGKFNDSTLKIVKSQGYKYATTTKFGIGDLTNNFELSRYRITNQTDMKSLLK